MLQTFKNWPSSTVAAICAGVLSVVFLLSIATLLTASSSSSVNAEPPEKGCVAVSQGEYQGAYRKKLLLTRFGTYERTGRLGQDFQLVLSLIAFDETCLFAKALTRCLVRISDQSRSWHTKQGSENCLALSLPTPPPAAACGIQRDLFPGGLRNLVIQK